MIEVMSAILAGILAHQTDRIVRDWPKQWEMLSRYIIGMLTVIAMFAFILYRLNRGAFRDGILSISTAAAGVGLGVAAARWYDETINKL